jgi:hypothetical protein
VIDVVVLVPRRADNGHRDRLWSFCRDWWAADHPDWRIVEGHDDGELPFNRAAAINRAAARAGAFDVAHVIDADVLADPLAVRTAVELAHSTGTIAVAHDRRMMLTKQATARVLDGYRGSWEQRGWVQKIWPDSISCSVSIPRSLFDELDGFDERFVGWGFEDTAFAIAAEARTGRPCVRVNADVWHLHHEANPDARASSSTFKANKQRVERYRSAARDWPAVQQLLSERTCEPSVDTARELVDELLPQSSGQPDDVSSTSIPRILHRTVPAETSEQVELWWQQFEQLHPSWELRTYREPIDLNDWPLTGDLLDSCENGAQRAGLIRLEALWTYGGVYVDSDVQPVRALDSLLDVRAFAAWEDETTVPDAVLGSTPHHPAFEQMLVKARRVIEGGGDAWHSGPGVTTETLPRRDDVLVLPPGAFYDVHYLQKR